MTDPTTARTGPQGAVADAVRACAAGTADPASLGIEIVRRAERGADELLLVVHVDASWWVARRVEGVARVCAYIGDLEAERDFDLFLASPSPRGQWREIEIPAAAA